MNTKSQLLALYTDPEHSVTNGRTDGRPRGIVMPTADGTVCNRKLLAGNTLVQLLALYTDPECHNAQCYRQTDR